MRVLKPGTHYALLNYGSETATQELVFTHKLPDGSFAQGTTNEEVVNVLIERFMHLNTQRYSTENSVNIELLKTIRQNLAKRVTRKAENVREQNDKTSAR